MYLLLGALFTTMIININLDLFLCLEFFIVMFFVD